MCILGEASDEADHAVTALARAYWAEAGHAGEPKVFRGSSGGAASFGHVELSDL